jgi:hypothetical protein
MVANDIFFCIFLKERVSSHGGSLGAITTIGTGSSGGTASFTSAPRMTPTTDFQPPYFPPPFPTTQQQIDFHAAAHLTAGDPYSQLNSLHQQHYQVSGNFSNSYLFYFELYRCIISGESIILTYV